MTEIVSRARGLAASHVGQSVLGLADQGTVSATRLLLSILIGRALGAEGLAGYALAITLISLCETVVEALVTLPYTVLGVRDVNRPSYAGSALVHAAAIGLLGAGLALGASFAVVDALGVPHLDHVLLTLAAVLPARALMEAARRIAFAHERPGEALVMDAALAIVLAGGAVALWLGDALTVVRVLELYGIGSALPFIGWLVVRRGGYRVDRGRVWTDLAASWRFGRWVLGGQVAVSFRGNGLPWLLAALVSAAAVGLFDASLKVIGLTTPLLAGLINVLTPRIANAREEGGVQGVRSLVAKTTVAMTALTAAIAVGLTLSADVLLGTLFGPEFVGQQLVVGLLGVGVVAEAVGIPANSGIWAIERPSVGFWIHATSLVVMAAAVLLLVPVFGLAGAAGSLAITSVWTAALQLGSFVWLTRGPATPPRVALSPR